MRHCASIGRPAWVSRKLAVGAVIISLQAVTGIPAAASGSCYELAPAPSVAVDATMARGSRQTLAGYEREGIVEVLRVPAGEVPVIPISLLYARGNQAFTYRLFLGDELVDEGSIKPPAAQDNAYSAPAVIRFAPAKLDKGMYLLKFFLGSGSAANDKTLCRAYGVLVE